MIINYFNAIPIASENTTFLLNEKEKQIIKSLTYKENGDKVKVSLSSNILEDKKLKRIKSFFLKKIKEYKENIIEIENTISLTQSWSTINIKGSHHHIHSHPNSFLSLVYYVDCDINSGDFMVLKDKSSIQKGYNFNYTIKNFNEFNSDTWRFNTIPGQIIIFPGHLNHYSTPHLGDEDRIIIGANFFVEGILGEEDNTDLINLKLNGTR